MSVSSRSAPAVAQLTLTLTPDAPSWAKTTWGQEEVAGRVSSARPDLGTWTAAEAPPAESETDPLRGAPAGSESSTKKRFFCPT